MNSPKFLKQTIGLIIVFLAGCATPAPTLSPTLPPPPTGPLPPTSAQPVPPTVQPRLFTLVRSVTVTPVDNITSGSFVRVGYVPGRDRIIVTFKARLTKAGCNNIYANDIYAYGYREYTKDMVETGNQGVFSCLTGPDIGGGFIGDNFYAVAMDRDPASNLEGWLLAEYNAVNWTSLVAPFFHPLAIGELDDDPMVALVNGQIDISSHYKSAGEIGPGHATHHQFFTPDLQFVTNRVITDTSHINLTSLLVVNGVINFITSTDLWGDMIVMQYDTNWNYLGMKTIKERASAPEGAAFDGTRFYVSYIDNSACNPGTLCKDNVRLAAFDANWNLLDDIAVTNFGPQDLKAPGRPSMTLYNGLIYVCYDQNENATSAEIDSNPDTANIQVHVEVYEFTQKP